LLTKLFHQGKWQDDANGHNDDQIVAIQEPLTISKRERERERERENKVAVSPTARNTASVYVFLTTVGGLGLL